MDDFIQDFVIETRDGLEALDGGLVRFEQHPDDPQLLSDVFRLVHSIKGACGFIGLTRLQRIAHAAETVLDSWREGAAPSVDGVSAVLAAVDRIRSLVEALATTGAEPPGDDGALIHSLEYLDQPKVIIELAGDRAGADPGVAISPPSLLERVGGEATLDAACESVIARLVDPRAASPSAPPVGDADPAILQALLREALAGSARGAADLGALVEAWRRATGTKPSPRFVEGLLEALREAMVALDVAAPDAEALVGAFAPSAPPAVAAPAPPEAEVAKTIRVSVDSLEHLMTVASELVLIRNQLLQLLRLDPESAFAAPLHRLNQVASELQEGVMTARMQPIDGAWSKLPRLVRDLAHDLGKKIELVLTGQDTELDRQVLELIRDPLTHMIRNAADHGLETPAQRLAAGKAETGRICLSARHEGGAIVIEMSDDGRGLSLARIKAKAVAAGLIGAPQAEAMADAEARRLIFQPGFSTAEQVSAVSGRGVGMDVVRTNIEKIGGVIEVASAEGRGTTFTIRIPLTLTIISALIVECCGERFAMPQSSVIELVSANDASGRVIERIGGAAVLRLRDRLLPLVSLQAMLGLPPEEARSGETCIVVAKVGGFTFGVIVDRVFDTEEIVVKPVASVLRHLRLYSGATILGDGSVIMILDFNGMAVEAGAERAPPGEEEANAEAEADDARVALLTFRAGPGGALKAAPLSAVSRIEELAAGQLERSGGLSVLQYRGRLTPVLDVDGEPAGATDGVRPLLVFSRGDAALGLLVDEIVDIVESPLKVQLQSARPGVVGSLVVAGQAAELIDLEHFWRCAGRGGGEAPSEGAARRLLVLDQSPFSQMLLRPLLARAGYAVTVAGEPETALALYDAGEAFDLILADTARKDPSARRLAAALARAERWHATPMIGLGLHRPDEVLGAVEDSLSGWAGAAA